MRHLPVSLISPPSTSKYCPITLLTMMATELYNNRHRGTNETLAGEALLVNVLQFLYNDERDCACAYVLFGRSDLTAGLMVESSTNEANVLVENLSTASS